MNLQTDLSGQISGNVLNQVGASLSALPQQNVNPGPGQMQNSNVRPSLSNMDPERRFIQQKIFEFLMQRRQHSQEAPPTKIFDLVKRLELGLFKSCQTRDEYLNLETLGNRLQVLIKRLSMGNHNQQLQQANSSPPIGTMIPTPGFQPPGSSSLTRTSPSDSSVATNHVSAPSAFNSGNFMPTGNGSSGNMHGALPSGYHQSSSFSTNPGGNHLISSMGAQRPTSQMIPTPGFNNSNDANNNSNTQSFTTSSNDGAFAAAKTTTVSQPIRQMQHGGSQNSRILRNLGGPMGGGIRSTLQQHSSGISNGSLNGGLGMMGNNMPQINGPGATEGYLTETMHQNSARPLNPRFEQQRPVIPGDGYGTANSVASGPGNSYIPITSAGMMMNSELNAATMQSVSRTNSGMVSQPNMDSAQQMRNTELQSTNQSDNMNTQYHFSVRENLVQSHESQNERLVQNETLQNQQSANQLWLNEDIFSQSQFSTSMVSESKSRNGREYHVEGLQSQVAERGQFSDMQSPYEQNSREDHARSTQLLPNLAGPQDVQSSRTLNSVQMRQLSSNPQNNNDSHSGGALRGAASHGQWSSKSQDASNVSGRNPLNESVKRELHYRSTGEDAAQPNNLSSEESMIFRSDASRSANNPNMSNSVRGFDRAEQYKNQQKWLALLMHARRCKDQEKCLEKNCLTVQKLLRHVEHCAPAPGSEEHCPYPRCHSSKALISHFRKCRDPSCPVCVRVRNFARSEQLKALASSNISSGLPGLVNGSRKPYDTYNNSARSMLKTSPLLAQTPEDLQPSIKRIKLEQVSQPLVSVSEDSGVLVSGVNEPPPPQDAHHVDQHLESHSVKKSDISEVKMEVSESVGQSSPKIFEKNKDSLDNANVKKLEGDSVSSQNPSGFGVQEVIIKNETGKNNTEMMSVPPESASKSGKPKVKAVSMTELFTPEQVRQHITGLRQWVGQSKAKAERNQAMEHSMSENSCQLCAVERLTFEPPPLYCTSCGARIKRNAMYYTIGAGETRHYFCIPCYNEARGDTMKVDGMAISKARMEKKKNDEETEESWVQCDKCEAWQHQICALFNARRNDCGQAEYTCPNCYVEEVERGERVPLPQSAVLGAKDLPRTILSDHLEERLFAKLRQERQDRARSQGKAYDEVPGADSLVVRVVSSVDKKLEVKPRFLEIFREENYPTEFPYKSKVVLLFQKIEGVEVCLFGMYLQEFGSECQQPNHRRVYLSYLDSVKYFRPDVKTVTGEALRTFVYHEILIGYLEYCKQRGFSSCYIWACPPLKGEDYILYCHPEIQKTPRSDKLREWYLSMLRKAMKENIVVELTNLHEHFFVSNGECRAKITASRLPYFDGDYWPGAAEDMIFQLQEEEDGRKQPKKGAMKKTISKRALKASGQLDLSGKASKDLMLMHKLGETISPMKEDFIMVNLQPTCTHCCILMVCGRSWFCRQCRNFQLCEKCYEAERRREDRERHPINQKDKHALYPVEIQGIPDSTKDKDDVLESEFFDTRQAFLSLCQGNHYQYDTLRRAKHSSMMVLYHLHNPTAPAFVATCNLCHQDIETGQGWRCETCPEYDVCNSCHQKDRGMSHPHKLISYSSSAQNTEARALRVMQLKKMLELLVHASRCRSAQCQYPNCRKVKGLFRHGMACKVRAGGGCILCKKMWNLLQLHARTCKESQCTVPRCRDLKEHTLRQQHQSENRRRAAFNEMIVRQRAADSNEDS